MKFPEGLEQITATVRDGTLEGCRAPNLAAVRSLIGHIRQIDCPAVFNLARRVAVDLCPMLRKRPERVDGRNELNVMFGMVGHELVILFLDREPGHADDCPGTVMVVPAEVVAGVCGNVAAAMVNAPRTKSCGKAN